MKNGVLNRERSTGKNARKAKAWDKLFGGPQASKVASVKTIATGSNTIDVAETPFTKLAAPAVQTTPIDLPICAKLADECIANYEAAFDPTKPTFNIATVKAAYTWKMKFGSVNLRDWIEDVFNHTNVTAIEIRLGIYTGAILTQFPELAVKAGRLTAFFYPVDATGALAKYTSDSNYMPPAGALDCSAQARTAPAAEDDDVPVYDFAGIEP